MREPVKFRWATKEEMKQTLYIEWRDRQDMLDYLHNIKHPVTVSSKWKLNEG